MIEAKLKGFSALPDSELSAIGSTPKIENENASIEKEFNETNQHTKQAENTGQNQHKELTEANTSGESTESEGKQKKTRLGKLIKGELPIKLVDILIPTVLVYSFNLAGYRIDGKQYKLSKDEKEALEPAIQDVLDSIELDFNNPWINLAVVAGIIYGAKTIEI